MLKFIAGFIIGFYAKRGAAVLLDRLLYEPEEDIEVPAPWR